MGQAAAGTRVTAQDATESAATPPGSVIVTCPAKGGHDKPRCRCPVQLTVEAVAA
jgi:hypothetical protein